MASYFLMAIIVFSGFLANLEKEKRFNFLKSVVMVGVESLIGILLFIGVGMILSLVREYFFTDYHALFVIVLLIAVINGFVLYWLNRYFIPKFKISLQVQILCEYVIQWGLIYITVYQVIFDNFIVPMNEGFNMESLDITKPSDLSFLILPALISVWIGIILYKVKEDNI